jgi:hypothetical protein
VEPGRLAEAADTEPTPEVTDEPDDEGGEGVFPRFVTKRLQGAVVEGRLAVARGGGLVKFLMAVMPPSQRVLNRENGPPDRGAVAGQLERCGCAGKSRVKGGT